jgi:hypothetical protein
MIAVDFLDAWLVLCLIVVTGRGTFQCPSLNLKSARYALVNVIQVLFSFSFLQPLNRILIKRQRQEDCTI